MSRRRSRQSTGKGLWFFVGLALIAFALFAYALIHRQGLYRQGLWSGGETERPPVIVVMVSGLRHDLFESVEFFQGAIPKSGKKSPKPQRPKGVAVAKSRVRLIEPELHPLPNLAAFYADSDRYLDAVTVSTDTRSSLATIMTGAYPQAHGVDPRDAHGATIAEPMSTMAEILKGHDYRTAAFLNQDSLTSEYDLDRGYDRFDFYGETWTDQKTGKLGRDAHGTTDAVLDWIDSAQDDPFHVLVQYNDALADVSEPEVYACDPSWLRRCRLAPLTPIAHNGLYGVALIRKTANGGRGLPKKVVDSMKRGYEGSLRFIDQEFGRLIERLKAQGLYEKSLIVLTSERGEAFGVHGKYMDQSLHWESSRIPLAVKYPFQEQNFNIRGLAQQNDILATISEIINDSTYDPSVLHGQSLIAARGSYLPRPWAFSIGKNGDVAMQSTKRKFVLEANLTPRLYDLKRDRQEKFNIAPRAIEMTRHFASHLRGLDADLAKTTSILSASDEWAMDFHGQESP